MTSLMAAFIGSPGIETRFQPGLRARLNGSRSVILMLRLEVLLVASFVHYRDFDIVLADSEAGGLVQELVAGGS